MSHSQRSPSGLALALARVHAATGVGVGGISTSGPSWHRWWSLRGGHPTPPAVRRQSSVSAGSHLRSEELARLEAALFLAREPLTARRLAKLARLEDGSRARTLVQQLRQLHEASGSAFRVEKIAGGFQLLSRAPFGPWVRRLQETAARGRLSPAAVETLAIVAYRQPVTRAEIEAIRGVGSEEMLRQLLERDFVAVGGRAEDLGRPNVYVTTRRFLAAFGLASLDGLPPLDSLPGAASETGAAQPDEPTA